MEEDWLSINGDSISGVSSFLGHTSNPPRQRSHDETIPEDFHISNEYKRACIQDISDSIKIMQLYQNPIEFNFHMYQLIKFMKKIKCKKEMESKKEAVSHFGNLPPQPNMVNASNLTGSCNGADIVGCSGFVNREHSSLMRGHKEGRSQVEVQERLHPMHPVANSHSNSSFHPHATRLEPFTVSHHDATNGMAKLADKWHRPDDVVPIDSRGNYLDPWNIETCPSEITSEREQGMRNDQDDDDGEVDEDDGDGEVDEDDDDGDKNDETLVEKEEDLVKSRRLSHERLTAQPTGYSNVSVVSQGNTTSVLTRSVLNSCTDLPYNSNNASIAINPFASKLKLLTSGKSIMKFGNKNIGEEVKENEVTSTATRPAKAGSGGKKKKVSVVDPEPIPEPSNLPNRKQKGSNNSSKGKKVASSKDETSAAPSKVKSSSPDDASSKKKKEKLVQPKPKSAAKSKGKNQSKENLKPDKVQAPLDEISASPSKEKNSSQDVAPSKKKKNTKEKLVQPKPKTTAKSKGKSKSKDNLKPDEVQVPLDDVKENRGKKKVNAEKSKASLDDFFDGFEASFMTDINTAPISPGAVLNSAKKCWGEISSGRQTPPTSMLGHLYNIQNNPTHFNTSHASAGAQQRPNNRKQLVKRVANDSKPGKKGKTNQKDEPGPKSQACITGANIETDTSELDKIMEAAKARTLRTPTILKQVFRQNKKTRHSSDEDDSEDFSDDDSESIG